MKIIRAHSFERDFKKLPESIKRKTEKSLRLLIINSFHPSLRIKKTKGRLIRSQSNIFEGRIDRNYRFLFLIQKDIYILLRCGDHDEFFR